MYSRQASPDHSVSELVVLTEDKEAHVEAGVHDGDDGLESDVDPHGGRGRGQEGGQDVEQRTQEHHGPPTPPEGREDARLSLVSS